MRDIVGLNIVILPSEEIKRQAIEWSKTLSDQFNTKFTLDGITYHPHLTVYQSTFPSERMSLIIESLKNIAATLTPFEISFDTVKTFENFIFYQAVKTQTLQHLHEIILQSISPFYVPQENSLVDLHGFPSYIQKNIAAYGYSLAKEYYLPHITLSRCQTNEEATQAIEEIQRENYSMEADSLWLTNVDHDGTCTKMLEKIPFGGTP